LLIDQIAKSEDMSMKKTVIFIGADRVYAKRLMELKIGTGEAKVNKLDGSAQVLPDGKKTWRTLTLRDTLRGGDEVRTGSRTRLELIMPDYSAIRFADNSHFKVLQLDSGDETRPRNVKVHVAVGRSWANLSRSVVKKGQFDLSCENAVAGVRGTIYRMNVEADKSALVRVYDGQVAVSGGGKDDQDRKPILGPPQKISGPKPIPGPKKVSMEEWVYIIKSMQQIRIGGDGKVEKPREFAEQEDRDDWVDWNKSQDSELKSMTE
jgi:hypothetical protein